MAEKVQMWRSADGRLWETEAQASDWDEVCQLEDFLTRHGWQDHEFNIRQAAEALHRFFEVLPREVPKP